MKKSKALIFVSIALVMPFGLIGCGMDAGTVSNKAFEPSHMEEYSNCRLVGKISLCTTETREVDDKWKLELTETKDNGKTKTDWVEVSQSDYDSYDVGEQYTVSE